MFQTANECYEWRYHDTDSNVIAAWYTLPTLEWLKTQNLKEWDVFEYGAGYSTFWWRLNAKSVHSVEHNPIWARAVSGRTYEFQDEEKYVKAVELPEIQFDCVVVDGLYRNECAIAAIPFVKTGGIIIIDNYEQPSVEADYDRANLALENWAKVVYKQAGHPDWQTAIFTKP